MLHKGKEKQPKEERRNSLQFEWGWAAGMAWLSEKGQRDAGTKHPKHKAVFTEPCCVCLLCLLQLVLGTRGVFNSTKSGGEGTE